MLGKDIKDLDDKLKFKKRFKKVMYGIKKNFVVMCWFFLIYYLLFEIYYKLDVVVYRFDFVIYRFLVVFY